MSTAYFLKLLDAGVEEWNFWRSVNSNIIINLHGINLSHREFRGFDFTQVRFLNADMSYSNFSNCVFDEAEVRFSNLSWSVLESISCLHTSFLGSKFYRSNLSHSDLRFADLRKTDFRFANLWNADMDDAFIEQANFLMASMKKEESL